MPLTANDCRRNAAHGQDPTLLIGPDIIHYAELLIRFHDHPVLSPHYQFWGNLADYLNRIMHLPDRPGRQNDSSWSEFNSATAMAAGYIEMSEAPDEYKRELLRKFFPPEPEPEPEYSDPSRATTLSKLGMPADQIQAALNADARREGHENDTQAQWRPEPEN
jgi:hypothetical protein